MEFGEHEHVDLTREETGLKWSSPHTVQGWMVISMSTFIYVAISNCLRVKVIQSRRNGIEIAPLNFVGYLSCGSL